MNAFPPIADCLPHRGPMLLVERIVASTEEAIRVEARVDGAAWYADADGAMPAWIGVELMAQTTGAHIGFQALMGIAAARPGVLLGTRRYTMQAPRFAAGSRLVIDAERVLWTEEGHGAYACTIRLMVPSGTDDTDHGPTARRETPAPEVLAEGVIKVFQPADFAAFSERSKGE